MNPALLLSTLLLLIVSLLPQITAAQIGPDTIEVAFTPDMDRTQLEQIREEVKACGVDLSYGVVEYDGDSLRTLEIHVEVPKASGKAATAALGQHGPFGFLYIARHGESPVLMVGNLRMTAGPMQQGPPKFR